MLASHTGAYIAKSTKEVLEKFGISVDDVYTVTSDNGANVIRASNVMKLYQSHLIDDFLTSSLQFHEQEEAYNVFIDSELKRLNATIKDDDSGKYLHQIRCAAHTLELAINDALKNCELAAEIINVAREIVKKLRTDNIMNLIVVKNLPKPKIDCPTRWSSTNGMIDSLLQLEIFCKELALVNDDFRMDTQFWLDLKELSVVLNITTEALTKLQSKTLVLSDVYGIFLGVKLQLKKFSRNDLAIQLEKEISSREKKVLQTTPMFSSMFLDPRFQCMLEKDERKPAIEHLVKLHERICRNEIKNMNNSSVDMSEVNASSLNITANHDLSVEDPEDLLENMLRMRCKSLPDIRPRQNIEVLLNEFNFCGRNRISSSEKVLEFWRNNEEARPELFKLAAIVFGAPPTEVTTERDFSSTNFILNKFRNKLDDETLDQILFVKLNEEIFLNTVL